jgi:hypothetical protein
VIHEKNLEEEKNILKIEQISDFSNIMQNIHNKMSMNNQEENTKLVIFTQTKKNE